MPGYVLLEQKYLSPPKAEGQGIKANSQEIGFSDFLRELGQDEFPFNENSSLRVVGLEEILLSSRPGMNETAMMIRNKLHEHANELLNRCGNIQIVFRGELVLGEHLMDNHVTAPIPIHLIFGSPPTAYDDNSNKYYNVSFNLVGN